MKLTGLHHITMITGAAQRIVDFYAGTLGLRLVKRTVNFDAPEAYHLYFGDEHGSPGTILTWFEFAGAPPGLPGAEMIHTIGLGVGTEAALDFWTQRLDTDGVPSRRNAGALSFADPDGLALELIVTDDGDPPLRADHPDVPAEYAIAGVVGARAYSDSIATVEPLLTETLGFEPAGPSEYRLLGSERRFRYALDAAPALRGRLGAGTVHHIAWGSRDEDHLAWQQRVRLDGGHVTEVKDRDYFRSIYFRALHGVLFEIATLSPGFAVDEDPAQLGEQLRLPKMHEHLRPQLERTLTPLVNPRTG